MAEVSSIAESARFHRLVAPSLAIRNLSKSFVGNPALRSVDLSIEPGEIRVLVGANGSGKSTLIKVLSGYHLPDPGGEVLIVGSPLEFGSPLSAYRLGCRFVHQDLGLVATRSVFDNLFVGSGYPTRAGTIRTRAAMKEAREMLSRVGLDIDPLQKVSDIGAAQRTGVAVGRALREDRIHPSRLLVLDEPTTALPVDEVDHLLSIVRAAAASDVAVLFVTHHLDEVFRVADSVTVLRDGRVIITSPIATIDRATLAERLIGKGLEDVHQSDGRSSISVKRSALVVRDLWAGPLRGFSLAAAPGDIIGIAGLTGSGRETVLGAVFGAIPREAGEVEVNGQVVRPGRPDLAIGAGVGFLSADRKASGGIMTLSALHNLTLPHLRTFWSGIHLSRSKEAAEGRHWFGRLQVRPQTALYEPLASFSGGNQQKILFAKWMRGKPAVLLLDEPTQGVDVGAKAELHRELLNAAEQGMVVILSSVDIEELTALCDRVLVLRHGRITDELVGPQVESARISHCVISDAKLMESDE